MQPYVRPKIKDPGLDPVIAGARMRHQKGLEVEAQKRSVAALSGGVLHKHLELTDIEREVKILEEGIQEYQDQMNLLEERRRDVEKAIKPHYVCPPLPNRRAPLAGCTARAAALRKEPDLTPPCAAARRSGARPLTGSSGRLRPSMRSVNRRSRSRLIMRSESTTRACRSSSTTSASTPPSNAGLTSSERHTRAASTRHHLRFDLRSVQCAA